jgi:hypothetical protein
VNIRTAEHGIAICYLLQLYLLFKGTNWTEDAAIRLHRSKDTYCSRVTIVDLLIQ